MQKPRIALVREVAGVVGTFGMAPATARGSGLELDRVQ